MLEVEEYRHQCEVREWIRRSSGQSGEWATKLLRDIAAKRGRQAAERLKRDIRRQLELGNEGDFGDWR